MSKGKVDEKMNNTQSLGALEDAINRTTLQSRKQDIEKLAELLETKAKWLRNLQKESK